MRNDLRMVFTRSDWRLTGLSGAAVIAAAVTTWTRHGIQVRGTAVAALTAQGLQDATGAPSVSLTRPLSIQSMDTTRPVSTVEISEPSACPCARHVSNLASRTPAATSRTAQEHK